MIVSISPPHYFPNAELLHRIIVSDVHVVLDTADFSENGLVHRCKYLAHNGVSWLTVPVLSKTVNRVPIKELSIYTGKPWEQNHFLSLKTAYKKSAYFKKYLPFLKSLYSKKWKNIVNLNIEIYDFIIQELGINTRIILSSDEGITGKYQNQIMKILDKTIARIYFSSPYDKAYFKEEKYVEQLEEMKVKIQYQDYTPAPYNQLHTGFTPLTGAIDLLMNAGKKAKEYILAKNAKKIKMY